MNRKKLRTPDPRKEITMKKTTIRTIAALAFGLAPALASGAGEHGSAHGAGAHSGMAHGQKAGQMIRESTVEGYKLSYELIDNAAQMEKMKGMSTKGHDMGKMKSHHLMLFLVGPDGKPVTEAKVGFLVKGPDGTEQKTMAEAMRNGFGADVELKAGGAYDIKAKALVGDKAVVDDFTYSLK